MHANDLQAFLKLLDEVFPPSAKNKNSIVLDDAGKLMICVWMSDEQGNYLQSFWPDSTKEVTREMLLAAKALVGKYGRKTVEVVPLKTLDPSTQVTVEYEPGTAVEPSIQRDWFQNGCPISPCNIEEDDKA